MAKNGRKDPGKVKKSGSQRVSTLTSKIENRENLRIPIQLLVDYKADGHYLFDFCRDLGSGGVFIQTKTPQPQGSEIQLTFTIPDSKETLTTQGKVIWVQPFMPERKELTPGMGVQFTKFSESSRKILEDFVQRHNSTSTQSGHAKTQKNKHKSAS